jgi:hypothetical protein
LPPAGTQANASSAAVKNSREPVCRRDSARHGKGSAPLAAAI